MMRTAPSAATVRGLCIAIALLAIPCSVRAGQDVASASEKGSLLIFPNVEIRWDAMGVLVQDTFFTVANDYPADVFVQLYFVNGDAPLPPDPMERAHPGWNRLTARMALTIDQPSYWSAMTGQPGGGGLPPFTALDPGMPPGRPDPEGSTDRVLRGFVYAWAIDLETGEEIRWNHLSGTAVNIDYRANAASEHKAIAHQVVAPVPHGALTGTPGQLNLDGAEYAPAFDELLLDFQAAGSAAFSGPTIVVSDSELTLLPVGADLRQASTGPVPTRVVFDVWNQNEVKFSGMTRCVSCWDQTLLRDFDLPNHFLLATLQTDHGYARIDADGNVACPDSQPSALHAISMRRLEFDGFDHAVSATNMVGIGAEAAVVQYDTTGPPPPESPSGSPAGAMLAGEPSEGGVPQDRVSVSDKGSVLVYSEVEIRWDAAGFLLQDTFLTLQNDFPDSVRVQAYFVNGDPPLDADGNERAHPGWNSFGVHFKLTGHQPVFWSALTGQPLGMSSFTVLDPGFPPGRPAMDGSGDRVLRGFVYVWAIDIATQHELRWNHLSGGGTVVNYQDSSTWSYSAAAFQAVDPIVPHGSPTGSPGAINLDGVEFSAGYDELMLEFQAANSAAFSGPALVVTDADVVLHPISADLRPGVSPPVTSQAVYAVWNMNEVKFAGMTRCVTCWDQTLMSNYDLPNMFLRQNLQTDHGKARIDGSAGPDCDVDFDLGDGLPLGADPRDVVSQNAAFLGATARHLEFDFSGRDVAGSNLVGMGTQNATIIHEVISPPPSACCLEGDCQMVAIEIDCVIAGGTFQGAGSSCGSAECPTDCSADLDDNGDQGFNDLLILLASWGPCPDCRADLDDSGTVGFGDLLLLLAAWGPCS